MKILLHRPIRFNQKRLKFGKNKIPRNELIGMSIVAPYCMQPGVCAYQCSIEPISTQSKQFIWFTYGAIESICRIHQWIINILAVLRFIEDFEDYILLQQNLCNKIIKNKLRFVLWILLEKKQRFCINSLKMINGCSFIPDCFIHNHFCESYCGSQ